MTTMEKEECMSHGRHWRNHLHYLLNKLTKTVIPTEYAQHLPGLVCNCSIGQSKYKTAWEHVTDDDLKDSVQTLTKKINHLSLEMSQRTILSDSCQHLTKALGQDFQDQPLDQLSTQQRSLLKMMYVLHKLLSKDYSLLEHFLLKKPLKTKQTLTFKIEVLPKEIPSLIGQGGSTIKTFTKTNQCFVTVHHKKTNHRSNAEVAIAVDVTITKDVVNMIELEKVKDKFAEYVASCKESYKIREQGMNDAFQYREAKRKENTVLENYDDGEEVKTFREDDFNVKSIKHQSDRKQRPQKSVLDHGHCLQCLKPFENLSDASECKHHPGYIVNTGSRKKWSCCDAETEERFQTYEDHQNSGCINSALHVWRTNKKMANKQSDTANRKLDTPKLRVAMSSREAFEMIQNDTIDFY